jgi:quinohemoprotein ethanol dehydrogenase
MFGGGMATDLRASVIATDFESFKSVLNNGAFTYMGMPKFEEITDEDIEALMHYIRKTAKETHPVYEDLVNNKTIESKNVNAGH